MQRVTLPGADTSLSRFIFGTSNQFDAGWRAVRQCVLDAAYEHGLTHFDTAPYYGFGVAERHLAPLLTRHPDASVMTKAGLYSPGGEQQPDLLALARKGLGRLLPAVSTHKRNWSMQRARAALHGSLRHLGATGSSCTCCTSPTGAPCQSTSGCAGSTTRSPPAG